MGQHYRVGEFAALSGVTVRTLHHYDRIGLLRPSAYTEGKQRLYTEPDLLRLQQILMFRYLGFPLQRIRELLDQPDFDLVASLRIQREVLRERISELERIDSVVDHLLERRLAGGRWPWDLVAQASTTVQGELTERRKNMDEHYTPEQMRQFEELGREIGAAERERIERDWTAVMADVRANRRLDPASPAAQALADRWNELQETTARAYQQYPDLWQAIGENIRQGNFADQPQAPQAEDFAFIARVNAAREGK